MTTQVRGQEQDFYEVQQKHAASLKVAEDLSARAGSLQQEVDKLTFLLQGVKDL